MKNTPPLVVAFVLLMLVPAALAQDTQANPLAEFTRAWREDPIWYDGKAECAVYDATRTIYGKQRTYQARLYTNKEAASRETFTKSATGEGREAFKHHLREDIATENYDYHYSTMCYVGTNDLKSLKLDMGSQEDCGATFKQFINHGRHLGWHQFSYFPNEGHRTGEAEPPVNLVFQDALSVVLRGYPFESPREVTLALLPDQTTNKWSPVEPVEAVVSYVGQETLALSVGEVAAHHLKVTPAGAADDAVMHYWFAAEGSGQKQGPGLHIMMQYEGPVGITYQLRKVERRAYWER